MFNIILAPTLRD
jgi:hypothetical protein